MEGELNKTNLNFIWLHEDSKFGKWIFYKHTIEKLEPWVLVKAVNSSLPPALLWLDYEMAIGFHFTAPFLAQSTIIPWAAASEKVMETPSVVMSLSC